MPGLSVILPYRQDEQRFESTLVSLLEHRPAGSEIIIVHDGSYDDPYDIGDEARLVALEDAGTVRLLNAGVACAKSSTVAVVLDGVEVQAGWADEAIEEVNRGAECVAICPASGPVRSGGVVPVTRATGKLVLGGGFDNSLGSSPYAGPSLACGLYSKSLLERVGGWNELLSPEAADLELAWLLQSVGVPSESVRAPVVNHFQRSSDKSIVSEWAQLCVAYGVTSSGTMAAITGWLSSVTAGQMSVASAWAQGLLGGPATRSAVARLNLAQQAFTSESDVIPFLPPADPSLAKAA